MVFGIFVSPDLNQLLMPIPKPNLLPMPDPQTLVISVPFNKILLFNKFQNGITVFYGEE
jgi:hypothetical protein